MDPISELVRSAKIPIGRWGKAFFDFLTTNFEWFFDSIADGVTYVLDGLVDLLLLIPPVLLVAAIAALAWWLQKSWKLALAVAIGLLFILNQNLWKETVETLVLVVASVTPTLLQEINRMGWTLTFLGGGSASLTSSKTVRPSSPSSCP